MRRVTRPATRPLSPERIAQIVRTRKPTPVSSPLADEIENAFIRLKATLATNDPDRVAANFDGVRTFDLLVNQFKPTNDVSPHRLRIGHQFEQGFAIAMLNSSWGRFDQFEIRHLTSLADGETVASIRIAVGNKHETFRCWLHKSGASWKLYDIEPLLVPLRSSHALAKLLVACMPRATQSSLQKQLDDLRDLGYAVGQRDANRARELIPGRGASNLPPSFQAAIHTFEGMNKLYGEKSPYHAMAACEQALDVDPDVSSAYLDLAICYNEIRRPSNAIASAQRHIELVGENTYAYREIGLAHLWARRIPQAIEAFEKALADDPDNATVLQILADHEPP
jgi:tetratricopeptide (TPR) repeat protein